MPEINEAIRSCLKMVLLLNTDAKKKKNQKIFSKRWLCHKTGIELPMLHKHSSSFDFDGQGHFKVKVKFSLGS